MCEAGGIHHWPWNLGDSNIGPHRRGTARGGGNKVIYTAQDWGVGPSGCDRAVAAATW